VPGYWLLRGKPSPQVSIVEGRVLGLPENSYPTLKNRFGLISNKVNLKRQWLWYGIYTLEVLYRQKFDGAVTDQFPYRMPLIKFSKAVDRKIIELSYAYMPGDEVIPCRYDIRDLYYDKSGSTHNGPPGISTMKEH
jgi:hypothetical protein